MINHIFIGLFIASLGGTAYLSYDYGVTSTRAEYEQKSKDYQESLRIAADELSKAQKERVVVTKTKVKEIYLEADSTGCADSAALDGVLNAHGYSSDRSTPHDGL